RLRTKGGPTTQEVKLETSCEEGPCVDDQGPPEVRFRIAEETGGTFVVVDVTDDTAIESVTWEEVGGEDNLELSQEQFTPGATMAQLKFRILDLTKNSVLKVRATDGCGAAACNDTQPPAVLTLNVAIYD